MSEIPDFIANHHLYEFACPECGSRDVNPFKTTASTFAWYCLSCHETFLEPVDLDQPPDLFCACGRRLEPPDPDSGRDWSCSHCEAFSLYFDPSAPLEL